jgi:triphosphoribosyl-dephospho-CoA synthase
MQQAVIEQAFLDACRNELGAPKPGNVHCYAAGHQMTVADFERSAAAAAPHLCRHGTRLGQRILEAVVATRRAVGQNTNLGILMLAAPLALAAEQDGVDQEGVQNIVRAADLNDTEALFAAIRLAAPGGLGDAPEHDVHGPAAVPPIVAMAAAADRDSIARQWVNGFDDIFGRGLHAYAEARERGWDETWSALATYLCFLAAFQDSHIVRKYGSGPARIVQRDAAFWRARLLATLDPANLLPELLLWDAELKQQGLNPGTSADLTVATIFTSRLRNSLRFQGI